MSKLALGKGLADWLKHRPVGKPMSSSDSAPPVPVTPGVEVLLRGKNGNGETAQPSTAETASTRFWPKIRCVLWAADLLLIAFCVLLTLSRRHPLGFLELALCILASCLGASLAVIALLGPSFYWPKSKK